MEGEVSTTSYLGCSLTGCPLLQLRYSQVALTQDTDNDSYSHTPTYPPRERFFIDPKNAVSAVKCRLAVADERGELCFIVAIPYTPRKGSQS